MTIKEVTFFFNKEPGSLDLRFLKAQQDSTRIAVLPKEASNAVSDLFNRLIKENPSKYKAVLNSLGNFSVTLFPQPNATHMRLEIKTPEVSIHFKQLKEETAALFTQSLPSDKASVFPRLTSEEKAQLRAEKLHQEVLEYTTPEETNSDAPLDGGKSIAETEKSASSKTQPKKRTKQEIATQTVTSLMQGQFYKTNITRSPKSEEELFGTYLMERVLGQPESCEFNIETCEFTLVYAAEKRIPLKNLPENNSKEALAALKPLHNATLRIPKILKGKFNIDEGKLTFEPGCLRLEWRWSSAQLLGIFENRAIKNAVTMQIKYLGQAVEGPVQAQDFVDMLECNLKQSIKLL